MEARAGAALVIGLCVLGEAGERAVLKDIRELGPSAERLTAAADGGEQSKGQRALACS